MSNPYYNYNNDLTPLSKIRSQEVDDQFDAIEDAFDMLSLGLDGNLPTGGTSGQVLTKNSGENYDTAWASLPSQGGLWEFDTTVKTGDFTAEAGKYYFVDATSAAVNVTLPSSPSAGDVVGARVLTGEYPVEFASPATIEEVVAPPTWEVNISPEQPYVGLVYLDATYGWVVFMGSVSTAPVE